MTGASGSRTMIVTGGSRGIGAATARLAARDGWDVCINFLSAEAAARSVAAEVERAGRRAIIVQGDMAREADIVRLFDTAARELGAPDRLALKVPTADLEELSPGKPDEDAHGVTYAQIDAFLHGEPVDQHAFDIIVSTYRKTQHKRELPFAP